MLWAPFHLDAIQAAHRRAHARGIARVRMRLKPMTLQELDGRGIRRHHPFRH
jgi:hypothetical protein